MCIGVLAIRDQVKIVSKWSCEYFAIAELITMRVFVRLYEVYEGLENYEENTWAVWITLKNSFEEPKNVTNPIFG